MTSPAVPSRRRDVRRAQTRSGLRPYANTADTFTNNPNSPIQWPLTRGVLISSGFGPRIAPCRGCSSEGIDMTPRIGTLGVYARVDHIIDGRKLSSVYAHMLSTGPHLLVGILLDGAQAVDPFAWLKKEASP